MKKIFLLLAVIIQQNFIFSQQKPFTISEAVIGLSSNLRIENIQQLNWIPGENAYTRMNRTPSGIELVKTQLPENKTSILVSNKDFEPNFFPYFKWLNKNTAYYQKENSYFTFDVNSKKSQLWTELPEKAEAVEIDNSQKQLAYVLDNNLFLLDSEGKKHQITTDGKYEIVNGKSVHREEFGIEKGIFFSPKGNFVAFYQMDQSMVEDYPIIDWTSIPAVNHNIKYPFAGRTSHQVTLGVFNPKTQKNVFMQTGEPKEQYLTCVTWSPDEKFIYIGILNRDQNHLKLNQYSAADGKFIKTLFEEKDDKYVQPQHNLYFLPDGKEFVWWSQRDGFMHLYRYTSEGKLLNQITKGNWLVNEIVGINASKNQLLITTSKDSPMEKHLYSVDWKNGKLKKLDQDSGTHNGMVSDSGEYAIDVWNNDTTPRKIDVFSTQNSFKENLLTAKNTLENYDRPKVENITLKADDGTDLYGKLIYPTHFDATKKYPVIVYLYNGPNVQLLANSFPASGNLWYEYMAQKGYVVFTMDGRGSSNRGLKFEQATFRKLGTVEIEDQMKGVEYLKSLSFVDSDRMGIHGWSFGGFMTTSFMLRKPDVFKVGVAGGPVMDWKMYEIMYTERYMDTPESNPQGYEDANLLTKTKNLKGKLLLIHGTQDNVVVWQHSIDFLKNAVDNNVQVDYFVYPGYEHNVRGKDRVHLMEKISEYFDLYLKK